VNLLPQPNGPKDIMLKIIDNTPEVMSLLQEVLETVEDFKEDVLGEKGLTHKMAALYTDPNQHYMIED